MGRKASHRMTLPDGRIIPFGLLIKRGTVFCVQFRDVDDTRKQISTGQTDEQEAYGAACRIVLQHFRPDAISSILTWEAVVSRVNESVLRAESKKTYLKALRNFLKVFPRLTPQLVTEEIAARFVKTFSTTGFTKSHADNAKKYARSTNTVRATIRNLSALWELVSLLPNHWKTVKAPKAITKDVAIPSDEAFDHFSAYLESRYPGWELIKLVFDVKALVGSRTTDVCSLPSSCLATPGRLLIEASITKTGKPRSLPLPGDLYVALRRIAGPKYLWEKYATESRERRPNPRNRSTFEPSTLTWAMQNICREHAQAHPEHKIRPHDFRRRAITILTRVTGSPHAAAQVIGMSLQTATKYYLDAKRSADNDLTLSQSFEHLRLGKKGGETG